jgi:hypothetical protein
MKGKISRLRSLISSEELQGSCASRETSASLDFFLPFGASGHGNLLDRRSGDPRHFGRNLRLWRTRNGSLRRRSSCGIQLWFFVITANKKQVLYNPKERSKERQ